MPKKPIVVGILSMLVAVAAYVVQAPGRVESATKTASHGPLEADGGGQAAAEEHARWDDADWDAFALRVRAALADHLDTASMGETVAAVGRSFVGTAYVPRTLEVDGPERLVIGFSGLDCVTFVENALAMARFVHSPGAGGLLEDRPRAELRYETLLAQIRYRGGVLDGYPSRLHYFTDWIADAEAKELVTDVTADLGGVDDSEAVDFMSTHAEAYRQLSETSNLEAIRDTEARLTSRGRRYLPQEAVAEVSSSIENGDIIAATSTVAGLDVAHTGLALWVGGELRLLHAPLVGDSVQISEEPLARRLRRIESQDGIMVARPAEVR